MSGCMICNFDPLLAQVLYDVGLLVVWHSCGEGSTVALGSCGEDHSVRLYDVAL